MPKTIVALFVLSVVVPFGTFGVSTTNQRNEIAMEARRDATATIGVMREVARDQLEKASLVLDLVEDMTLQMDDQSLRKPEVQSRLAATVSGLQQFTTIWIADSQGNIVTGSRLFEKPLSVANRDFFRVQRDNPVRQYIGEPYFGAVMKEEVFTVSRRRSSPTGAFLGTVHVSTGVSQIEAAFRGAVRGTDGTAALLREDGVTIARYPQGDNKQQILPMDRLLQRIAAEPAGDAEYETTGPDGTPLVLGYYPMTPFPAYVAYGVDMPARLAAWRARAERDGAVALVATLLLVLAALFTWRSAKDRAAVAAALRDEAERRADAEARLREAEALEALGRMARGVAHDLNNLLTVVLGNLETLEESAPNTGARDVARRARNAAAAGAALAANLLAYARTQVLQVETIPLTEVLRDVQPLLQDLAGHASDVQLELAAGAMPCHIDLAQFRATMSNLVTNARDAMPTGGRILISARPVVLEASDLGEGTAAKPGRFIAIAVSDTGIGMDDEAMSHAFDPFFTTKAVGAGSGLGLSQVFGLVHQLNGKISLQSASGQGTTVTLYLPAADMPASGYVPPMEARDDKMTRLEASPSDDTSLLRYPPVEAVGEKQAGATTPPAGVPVAGSAGRILVVEDQSEIRDLARRLLSRAGYEVLTAGGGREALDMIAKGARIDLVLSDLLMPNDIDGLTLVRRVREIFPLIPAVLMSGYTPDTQELSTTNASFVAKPFTRTALLEAVRKELA
jgi:signal transduction histidine kinase